ncbi:hypothetical protein [Thermoflexibacter ruber]|uniref:hypothetical protein n=1 Tax=Thermoflexibacter ruber TaxID=1003 RepID=UPI000B814534|nr:hypothetical protein [Thermoflexibacter ruber]
MIAHRISCRLCCGQAHVGRFPWEVAAPVQYGQRAKTFMSLLNVAYRLPHQKISQCFSDIYIGYALNEGTIVSANECLYERKKRKSKCVCKAEQWRTLMKREGM